MTNIFVKYHGRDPLHVYTVPADQAAQTVMFEATDIFDALDLAAKWPSVDTQWDGDECRAVVFAGSDVFADVYGVPA